MHVQVDDSVLEISIAGVSSVNEVLILLSNSILIAKVYKIYQFTYFTIDTLMSSLEMLRVYVAPVGFEIDRIVIPAIQKKTDRVWLITHTVIRVSTRHFILSLQFEIC